MPTDKIKVPQTYYKIFYSGMMLPIKVEWDYVDLLSYGVRIQNKYNDGPHTIYPWSSIAKVEETREWKEIERRVNESS